VTHALPLILIAATILFLVYQFFRNRSSAPLNGSNVPWHPDLTFKDPHPSGQPIAQGIDSTVTALIKKGNMSDAIGLYRELHGTDRKTAKDAVEALAQTLRP
jgi:hypothetical protein